MRLSAQLADNCRNESQFPRPLRLLKLICVLLLLACCVETHPGRARVHGLITEATVESIRHHRPRSIQIRSGGAIAAAGLDLADYVEQNRVSIVIDGLCGSSCAQDLLAASVDSEALPGSFLLYHNTATAMKAVVALDRDPRVVHFFDDGSERELRRYREHGLDARLLLWPLYRMHILCYSVIEFRGQDHITDVGWMGQLNGWSASQSLLARAGLHIRGHLPETREEFAAVLRRGNSQVPATTFWFETEEPDLSFAQLEAALQGRPRCLTIETQSPVTVETHGRAAATSPR